MTAPSCEIWMASHRGPKPATADSLRASGVRHQVISGVSDTALARNIQLTKALEESPWKSDIVLMVDDDMVFSPEHVATVAQHAADLLAPVSAMYLLADRRVAGTCVRKSEDWKQAFWATGLGFLAIPRVLLAELGAGSERVKGDAATMPELIAFCWSGPGRIYPDEDPRWLSEDYNLTARLGFARMAPVGVGHVKELRLWPDPDQVAEVETLGSAAFEPKKEDAA